MPTEQDILLSTRTALAARTALKNIVRLIPAVVIIAAMLNILSCDTSGLLGSGNNGSGSPTATPTTGTGTLAFVTNYNDGKVSSFTRNTTTGALKHTGQVGAGAKKGPRGVVASPNGSFLYVANKKDDNIYEYSINSTKGTLTPLSPAAVSNGSGTGPDELAISSDGTLLWVTGAAGTVTWYTVDDTTGQITSGGSIGGFSAPYGITLHPSLAVLYVSDTSTGLIWPMTYDTSTGALTKNFTAVHSADGSANKPAAIAIDSGADSLFIADQVLGEVSSFTMNTTTGALAAASVYPNSSTGDVPIGLGMATNGSFQYLYTANNGGNSVSSFLASLTTLTEPPALVTGYTGATGLVVDPQNLFVYTANNGNGTVGQVIINGTCGASICAGTSIPTESPANAGSGPWGITLAQ
ncbi:MAG: beta-propeller fold lactonase family protein [Candidatus Binatus sp.]|jgi:6-phosphogluconolactonase (cycloisomerase 2 family)|uniref:lactonase family protein n=1 Tax=Candidatus Binatus sp. TaxID=2811406 RepID=UPI003D0FB074